MKPRIVILFCLLFGNLHAQSTDWAASFLRIEEMPYICETGSAANCGDARYWEAVATGTDIIPKMIRLLADDRETPASVPYFGGHYAVGDVALNVLAELIHGLPVLQIMGVEFDHEGCGYCAYWQHLRAGPERRRQFRRRVRRWWKQNRESLKWVNGDDIATCDCNGPHPANGYFQVP